MRDESAPAYLDAILPVSSGVRIMHLMVDIETASREPGAAILSIGACLFHPYVVSTHDDMPAMEWRISTDSNMAYNRHFSQDTLDWWRQQDVRARQIAFSGEMDLKDALTELARFGVGCEKVWANDPDFDCVHLESACKATNAPWLFAYWSRLSVRTVKWLAYPAGGAPKMDGLAHSAMEDCLFQANLVSTCIQQIGYFPNFD